METLVAADHSTVPVAGSSAAGRYWATEPVGGPAKSDSPVPIAYTKSCEPWRSVAGTFSRGKLHKVAPVDGSRARIPPRDMLKAANMLDTTTPAPHRAGCMLAVPANMA